MDLRRWLAVATVLFAGASGGALAQVPGGDGVQRMWIVLTFEGQAGRESKMAFNNPSVPRMRPSECREVLPEATPSLVQAARQREPSLAPLRFIRSECIAGERDPLRPR